MSKKDALSQTYPHLPADWRDCAIFNPRATNRNNMSDAFMKFKEIVGRSQTFAVSAGETSDISKILAAATLNTALRKLGKNSGFAYGAVPDDIKKFVSIISGEEFGGALRQKENIIIKFDSKALPAKELKYEKDGDFIKIVLEGVSAQNGEAELDISKIQIEKSVIPVDLLLLIDPKETEIDKILASTPHKEVIKISARDKSASVKIMEIIKTLCGEIPENFKEALWFLIEEEEKINPAPTKEGFAALRELWESGIDREKILRAREEIFTTPFNKLLGRALARSHYEKELSTLWSFLPKSDFLKIGAAGESSLLNVLNKLRALSPQSKFCALLWGSEEKKVSALLASADSQKLGELASFFATSPASSYFSTAPFDSFSEAEIKIRNFIRKVI